MDLMSINPNTLEAEDLIEGYKSLIWTERFSECGDFSLTTGLVNETREALPAGSYVRIAQSDELAIVDSHKIATNSDGTSVLTIEGRTFETSYEGRPAIANLDPLADAEYHIEDATPHEAMALIMSRIPDGLTNEWKQIFERPITVYRPTDLDRKIDYQVPGGSQYEAILDLARAYGVGIRTFIFYRGFERRYGVELYYGHDRSIQNGYGNSPVIFSSERGDFASEDYYLDYREYYNAGFVFTNNTTQGYYTIPKDGPSVPPRGVNAKILYVDGGDIKPPEDTGIRDRITYERALGQERLFSELSKRKLEPDVTFELSSDPSYKFGRGDSGDYFLGDIVTAQTLYGGRKNLQVSEYIRSEDETGYKEYPTLIDTPELDGVFVEF